MDPYPPWVTLPPREAYESQLRWRREVAEALSEAEAEIFSKEILLSAAASERQALTCYMLVGAYGPGPYLLKKTPVCPPPDSFADYALQLEDSLDWIAYREVRLHIRRCIVCANDMLAVYHDLIEDWAAELGPERAQPVLDAVAELDWDYLRRRYERDIHNKSD